MKNSKWTLDKLPDLTGKIILVTGANSGLGFESCKAFAGAGAEVIMACRSSEKGEEARKKIIVEFSQANIVVEELDLMSLESIRNFSATITEKYQKLDVLLNNAGIMMTPYQLTADGFESQLGTNHLGHFALTGLLMDLIKKTAGSRVVTVSSIAHKNGDMNIENLQYDNGEKYSPSKAYGRSKLANLMFTYELQRYFENNNIDAISVAAHPGVAITNLSKNMGSQWLVNLLTSIIGWMIPSAESGALSQIRASVEKDLKGGEYFGPGGFNEMRGFPVEVTSTPLSHDKELARKLWEVSEELTKVTYPK